MSLKSRPRARPKEASKEASKEEVSEASKEAASKEEASKEKSEKSKDEDSPSRGGPPSEAPLPWILGGFTQTEQEKIPRVALGGGKDSAMHDVGLTSHSIRRPSWRLAE